MCGLFGWQLAGTTTSDRLVLATALSMANATRGDESYGYWTPDTAPVRAVGSICKVQMATLAQFETLCAHTRYATQGDVKKDNAHPFTHRHLTGAHNGAVWNAYELDFRYPSRDFDVDSMHLIAHLAEGKPLAELEGYGAVVYTNAAKPGVVFMGRFRGELAAAKVKGGLVWSSDRDHLAAACRMAGFAATFLGVKEKVVYCADGGTLYRTSERLPVRDRAPMPVRVIDSRWKTGKTVRETSTGSVTTFDGIREASKAWRASAARRLHEELKTGWDILTANERE